jgi:transposase-like protein
MPTPNLSDAQVEEIVAVFRDSGLNLSEAARRLGMPRQTVQHRIRVARERGFLTDVEVRSPTEAQAAALADARTRKLAQYQRKKAKGDWRKPVLVHLPPRPFRLKLFGDPHLDADGCNFELFEKHWLEMDAGEGVYGVCIGDFFNNWRQSLSHLWKGEGDPSDAWLLFEHLMNERGEALIGACSGNHDDWTHAPADPIDMLMKRHGCRYRRGAIRLAIDVGGPIYMVSMRHKWRGHSMYPAAHGILRAAMMGWADDLMVGGHIHQDEQRIYVAPDGSISRICQIGTFKDYDEFVDVHGFMGPKISPCWDLVINPFRPPTDPERTAIFFDGETAADRLEYERRRQSP